MRVSIIIPYYNKFYLVAQRLQELLMYAPPGHEVILVDDASTEDHNHKYWTEQVNHPLFLKRMKNEKNLGFGESMNMGAKMATGDVLVFLSNDVVIGQDFIVPLLSMIDDTMLVGARLIDWKAGWNEFNFKGKPMIIPYLEGWFLACTLKVWCDLEGFDPIYAPYCMEDVDLSTKAVRKGYSLKLLYDNLEAPTLGANIPLRHIGAQTAGYDDSRNNITKENKKKFQKKWEDILG